MGYRSDVVFAAEFETKEIRDAAWIAAKLKYENLHQHHWDQFEHFHEDAIVFEVEQWKWYSSYDDVAAIEDMFKEFWHKDFDANVKEVQVGEDTADMTDEIYECESHRDQPEWFWDIYIQRSVSAPWKWEV